MSKKKKAAAVSQAPRLKKMYLETVVPALMKEFGITTPWRCLASTRSR